MKFRTVTIQMKAIGKYFSVVLFVMLHEVVLRFESVKLKSLSLTIQIKVTEQYFPVVLFSMPNNVVLTNDSVDKILKKCGHSNESQWAVLFCGAVYYAVQGGSNF